MAVAGMLLPLCRRVGECVSASQEPRRWFSVNCLSSPGCRALPCANANTCAFMHRAGLGNLSCWKNLCMMFSPLNFFFFLTRPVPWSGSLWDCTNSSAGDGPGSLKWHASVRGGSLKGPTAQCETQPDGDRLVRYRSWHVWLLCFSPT